MRIFLIALSSLLVVELDAAIRVQAMLPRQRYNRDDEEDTEDEEDTSEDNEPVTINPDQVSCYNIYYPESKIRKQKHLNILATCSLSAETKALVEETSCYHEVGFNRNDDKIVGGTKAEPHEFSFMANLDFCGGSLIDACHILTAAHCISADKDPSDYTIVLGDHNVNVDDGEKIEVTASKIQVHPDYDSKDSKGFDVAVITLSECVDVETEAIDVICMPADEDADFSEEDVTIAGWGLTKAGGDDGSDVLLKADVTVVQQSECSASYGDNYDENTMICASGVGIDSCQGDSGGPMFICPDNSNERCLQIGVVSFGKGCAEPDYPGVYANLANLSGWVDKVRNCD